MDSMRNGTKKNHPVKICGMAAAICWIVFSMTLIIRLTAGDGGYLGYQMLKYAPPEVSLLPAGEYPGMGDMTAGYLTGRTERFQYEFTDASGKTVICFHDYEEAHMADCRDLIRLDRTVMLLSGGALLILIGAGILKRRRSWDFCRGFLWGLRAVIAVAVIAAAWAVTDFSGFFITFHEIAFTNDGWLLNPGTDMLIRLMPEEFFISLGIRGAEWALAALAAPAVAARIVLRKKKGRENV